MRLILSALWMVVLLQSATAIAQPGDKMTFSIARSGGNCSFCIWISAEGEIVQSTPDDFLNFLTSSFGRDRGPGGTLVLNSPGGNLLAGMALGRLIRSEHMDTAIADTECEEHCSFGSVGVCASACAYAFLGGVNRYLDTPEYPSGRLFVHQFHKSPEAQLRRFEEPATELDLSTEQLISGVLTAYAVTMGVDARFVALAAMTSPTDLLEVTKAQAKELRVTTTSGYGPLAVEFSSTGARLVSRTLSTANADRSLSFVCSAKEAPTMVWRFYRPGLRDKPAQGSTFAVAQYRPSAGDISAGKPAQSLRLFPKSVSIDGDDVVLIFELSPDGVQFLSRIGAGELEIGLKTYNAFLNNIEGFNSSSDPNFARMLQFLFSRC